MALGTAPAWHGAAGLVSPWQHPRDHPGCASGRIQPLAGCGFCRCPPNHTFPWTLAESQCLPKSWCLHVLSAVSAEGGGAVEPRGARGAPCRGVLTQSLSFRGREALLCPVTVCCCLQETVHVYITKNVFKVE